MIPTWLQAGLWGLLAGAALLIGAGIALIIRVPRLVIAWIMAFGSGVLVSTLAFELVLEAYELDGLTSTGVGFLAGATVYTIVDWLLQKRGAQHRKRSGEQQVSEEEVSGSGLALAAGALLDGIPESIVIGLSMIGGGTVNLVTLLAIFMSNIPEGLSSAAGMKRAGRNTGYILGVWGTIAIASGLAAIVGYSVFDAFSDQVVAATTTVAAGAILAMIADTMIPEAFEDAQSSTGLITVIGFFAAFALHTIEG